MKVSDALKARKSTRAFLDQPVSHEQLERILNLARYAPSGANIQPWHVAVITGNTKSELSKRMEQAFRNGNPGKMEYQFYPENLKPCFKQRRNACGMQLYDSLGIDRHNKQGRSEQWVSNYYAFNAPVMLLFFMDASMQTGSYLDYGMFLQSLMLAAVEEGLATCPEVSLAQYPEIIKQSLGYSEDMRLICGMAVGYEDTDAAVNNYRTPRTDQASFVTFFE